MALTFKKYFLSNLFPRKSNDSPCQLSQISSNNFQIISNNQLSYLSENNSKRGTSLRQDDTSQFSTQLLCSEELRGLSKPALIWLFSLAGKAFVHPASCDKEVKMCTGRSKISTEASSEVSVILFCLKPLGCFFCDITLFSWHEHVSDPN